MLETRDAFLHPADFAARLLDDAVRLGPCLPDDELPFLVGLLADVAAELLRGDQCLVDRLVPLAERAELLVEALGFGLELLVEARQAFQLLGDLVAELVDALGIVAANRLAELVAANVERCEVEGFVHHTGLAPKRIVPKRTCVAPSSTATSKSLDMPIDSAVASWPAAQSWSRAARAPAKTRRKVDSSASSGAIVMTPRTRIPSSFDRCSPSAATSAGAIPPLVSSPTMFT